LPDFKHLDHIESSNIEYNDPFVRERLREINRDNAKFWISDFEIQDFCESLLLTHFPSINGIWLLEDHYTHLASLEFIKHTFELGLIEDRKFFLGGGGWLEQFADLLSKVGTQLQRLEEAWKDRWWEILVENNMKESDIPNHPAPLKGL
jgi:hypothetical protein